MTTGRNGHERIGAVFENHDGKPHTVTARALGDHGEIARETVDVPVDGSAQVTFDVPVDADVELQAVPDATADATVEDTRTGPTARQPIPTSDMTLEPAAAVTIFGILNGLGGSASQLLASSRVAGGDPVSINRVAIAGVLGLGGTIAASYILGGGN